MTDRIKELRIFLRMTQQEFADKLGVSRSNIASYEAGKSNVGDTSIALICKTFNVNEAWLRTGEGEMFLEAPKSELEALTARYDLEPDAVILIEKFIDLRPEQRQAIISYARQVALALNSLPSTDEAAGRSEGSIAAAEAAYEQAFGIASKQDTPASSITEGIPKRDVS